MIWNWFCCLSRIAPVKFHIGLCGIPTQTCTELLTRDFLKMSTMMIPSTASPAPSGNVQSSCQAGTCDLRPFAAGLYRKFSKAKREKIKQRLLKMKLKIVHQHVDADGRKRVNLFMQLMVTKQILCFLFVGKLIPGSNEFGCHSATCHVSEIHIACPFARLNSYCKS